MSEARIQANVDPEQVIAVQITYDSGWEAYTNRKRQPIRKDGIGLMVIEPDCNGQCDVLLQFTGGKETIVTRAMSLSAVLMTLAFAWRARRRRLARGRAA